MSKSQHSSKTYCASARHVLGDQVGNCRLSRADMEGFYTLFYLHIRCRPTRVLAQVLAPRFDKETLDEPTRRSGVAKETPAGGPIAPTHSSYIPHRTLKFLGPIEINPIFNLDAHWTLLQVGRKNHNRLRPKRRRRQIQLVTADQYVAQTGSNTDD